MMKTVAIAAPTVCNVPSEDRKAHLIGARGRRQDTMLETFCEKFNQFADAPGALAKMRELILNSAVTGRLSEQEPGDSPVSHLLESLAAAKARRVRTGRRSTAMAVAPESATSQPIVVPKHWAWVPLNEIGSISGGMTPSKAKSAFWDGDLNWFSSKDIKSDEITASELKITREAADATGLQSYSPGCLVIVARSGILKRTLPVAILRAEGTVNQDLKVLSPFVGGIERYLQIMLRGMTSFILDSLVKTGMTVQSLMYEEFEVQPFPLPPLAEQKRIVAKVDELMALCDQLEARQQEREDRHAVLARAALARFADAPSPASLQLLFHSSYAISPADLRKTILTLAVQGQLVTFEDTEEGQTVGDHVDFQNGYAFKSEWFKPDGIRLCRNVNISHGVLDWDESAFLDEEIAKDFKRFALSEGDIVLSLDRPLISSGLKVAQVKKSDLPCLLLQRVARPVPKHDQLDMSYFYLWLNSSEFVDSIDPGRSNGVPHISTRQVQLLRFVLPPLREQRRIVAKVSQLMSLVDELETQLVAARATASDLLSAVVAELTSSARSA